MEFDQVCGARLTRDKIKRNKKRKKKKKIFKNRKTKSNK
jgi:hypothetical protein